MATQTGLILSISVLLCSVLIQVSLGATNSEILAQPRRFPPEWENQTRTFMAWPHKESIWTWWYLKDTQWDIVRLAKAVAKFEPVVLLTSPHEMFNAKSMFGETANVDFVSLNVDDLWARDTVPVFVKAQDGSTIGIDFNFNGWGWKQEHFDDTRISQAICPKYNFIYDKAGIISEGGAMETDGEGTLLVTESALVNENRNPGKSKQQIEDELKRLLGVTKVIWIKGIKNEDITDAHVDSIVRFSSPGVVVLSRPFVIDAGDVWTQVYEDAKRVLETSTDAQGRKLKIVELPEPDPKKTGAAENPEFLATYINYLVVNGGVIVTKFGDVEADANALRIIQEVFPGREIVPIWFDNVAAGGGGIHCATHDQPE